MSRNSFLPPIWPVLLAVFLAAGCLMTKKTPHADAVDNLPEVAAAMYAGRTWLIADPQMAASEFARADRRAKGKSFTALLLLGTALLRTDKPAEALAAFERAGALEGAESLRGILFLLQDFARAMVALEQGAEPGAVPADASPEALAQAREKAVSHARSAAASLRELLARLLARDQFSQQARILLCRLKGRLPDIIPAPASGEKIRIEEGDPRPAGLLQLHPRYPAEARQNGIKGLVVVEALIDSEGCVVNNKTVSSEHPMLAQVAMEAVGAWVFEPTIRDGEAVDVYYQVPVGFMLH